MPDLAPFPALRYAPAAGPLRDLLAPPYDVIDSATGETLRARSPWNAVRLVLPEGEPPARHELAARRLADWRREGILEADSTPSVTVYEQEFDAAEGRLTRQALFAAVRLEPLGTGILPHERTHSGPKRDRLALTLATGTQLSPVFFVARDPDGRLLASLREAAAAADSGFRTPDGIGHRVRKLEDPAVARALCELAGAGSLLIADGHHRYETALEVARRLEGARSAAGRVLACVVSERDPGLLVRPTHRVLRPPASEGRHRDWAARLEPLFTSRELPEGSPAAAAAHAESAGVLVLHVAGRAMELTPRPEALAAADLDTADAAIPAVLLDRLVIRGLFGRDADEAAREGLLGYHREPGDAGNAVETGGPSAAAFLLPPVPLDAVWKITELGRRLPPKSTYFEPKVPSGILFRPLASS